MEEKRRKRKDGGEKSLGGQPEQAGGVPPEAEKAPSFVEALVDIIEGVADPDRVWEQRKRHAHQLLAAPSPSEEGLTLIIEQFSQMGRDKRDKEAGALVRQLKRKRAHLLDEQRSPRRRIPGTPRSRWEDPFQPP